ncbi:sulfatase-like hydrolase/transferase [Parapedomonas caeni]
MLDWTVRRWSCLLMVSLGLAACGGGEDDGGIDSAHNDPKWPAPNIVLIQASDLSPHDISAYVDGRFPTPNLKRLADAGVRFTQAYTASSAAGPARAGLMTGRHPSRFGYEYDNLPPEQDQAQSVGLPTDEVVIARMLKDTGYNTVGIGVWGLGGMTPDSPRYPVNKGYDDFFGTLAGETAYVDSPDDTITYVPAVKTSVSPMRDHNAMIVSGKDARMVPSGGYATDLFADKAVEAIDRLAGKPFFLSVTFNAPSVPLQAPAAMVAKVTNIADPATRVYAAMIMSLDAGVGRILDALDKRGLAGNTLVIFTANRGCNGLAEVCACDAGGIGAPTLYEGGLKVPLIMRWPAALTAGHSYDKAVSTIDLYATIMKAARARKPVGVRLESIDLLPYVRGDKKGAPRQQMIWLRRPMSALRQGQWKLIEDPDAGQTRLFDLSVDPFEHTDVAEQNPALVSQLKAQLQIGRAFAVDPLWLSRGKVDVDACGTATTVFQ